MPDDLDPVRARFADGWPSWISCGPGWYGILLRLHAELVAACPTIRYIQVKEKFAELRVYTTADGDDRVSALTDAAEQESRRTCEHCGAAGTTRQSKQSGWYRTLCDEHSEGYEDVPQS